MAEGDLELQDLYRDVLVDYYRDATYKGRLEPHDVHAHGVNPVCGDEIELTLTASGATIDEVKFSGHGCVISQASSSMMCEALEGKTFAQAREVAGSFKRFMLERTATAADLHADLEEACALEGVRKFPLRIKCALLAWNTLLQGLDASGEGLKDSEYQEKPMCDTGTKASPAPEASAAKELTFKQIGEAIAPVEDPEIHVSISELGLIYGAEIGESKDASGKRVKLTMSLTSPACPYGPMLLAAVHGALAKLPHVRDVDVDLSFDPVWDPKTMASEEAKDQLGIF
ncbi:MAG: SUF system NifU family Fe-S cluster assembly protein [Elusimicrobia bacterium CG1_02_63_36]|nr:MAG: SUF system NifU family Fe-S cluster assembly protein [Elusimicrobia bacterium CG1_02_63_36]PIP82783.1 MAG: SUF system NifU family Fe-S cluster assembly protein [Elusimicrobia bacterium CG22_combo_CG10-13_8_21_14_all_63_91]PJA16090.1 MAG: SUF system NifU family Fe-S cluster assembly protein [Elusimicrobia bacterium CG_4_10_14_0_2_um_filter_63_34]PJB24677.1 MAG: SUF system NifU family Fe-S cluster assembly protein [Elusimicrobia bacterium CG_4_9_14_3_um_filter_62_55]